MISRSLASEVLEAALKGADFAELFAEDTRRSTMMLVDGHIDQATVGRDAGVGVRLILNNRVAYATTNDLTKNGLLNSVEKAMAALTGQGKAGEVILVGGVAKNIHPVELIPIDVPMKRKADFLHNMCSAAKDYDAHIAQATGTLLGVDQNVLIANTEGVYMQDRRVRVRTSVMAVASDGADSQTGFIAPGALKGWEFIEQLNPQELGTFSAQQAMTMLRAGYCPAGVMPVIIAGGFGGVIFHEACGHSLEATQVARGGSEFCGKLGQKVASDIVTAIDDGTMPGEWGSINIDDEGNPAKRNVLIENGVLKGYMIDILGARLMSMKSTGSGRRQDYHYAPTSRMTNTFIAAGKDSEDEMFSTCGDGLYAKYMGGGSVNPTTGEFNFAVSEGYLIKNGKVDRPVRGATLIGRGSEIIKLIDRVGSDMTMAQGMCGSLSGSVPTNVGQPTIRVSRITVGGRENV